MFPDNERFKWFEAHAEKVVAHCRRTVMLPGASDKPACIYVPGGDDKYPSFWIRDYVMQCRSGFIGVEDMKTVLRFFLSNQNGAVRRNLDNNMRVDPWAIPDHINIPGVGDINFHKKYSDGPVFFPGTYSPTDYQGDGRFGLRPADDDIYEAVDLARIIVGFMDNSTAVKFLQSEVNGISIIERLHNGMEAMTVHPENGLCLNSPENWSASSFHDALKPMGFIAFTSVLRFRAAGTMVKFYGFVSDQKQMKHYQSMADLIAGSVVSKLQMSSGWLMAGSEVNRQPDVWATSMAVYYNLLRGVNAKSACKAMLKAYRDGTVAAAGYLRHTPTTADAIPGRKVWEDDKQSDYGIYQNGGYWPQPLGYYAYALMQVDNDAARQITREFIDHTRSFVEEGAPFEWFNPSIPLKETASLGRWYGASAVLPLEAFRRLSKCNQNDVLKK